MVTSSGVEGYLHIRRDDRDPPRRVRILPQCSHPSACLRDFGALFSAGGRECLEIASLLGAVGGEDLREGDDLAARFEACYLGSGIDACL